MTSSEVSTLPADAIMIIDLTNDSDDPPSTDHQSNPRVSPPIKQEPVEEHIKTDQVEPGGPAESVDEHAKITRVESIEPVQSDEVVGPSEPDFLHEHVHHVNNDLTQRPEDANAISPEQFQELNDPAFPPLPDFPLQNDIDVDDLQALRLYNENKSNFEDDEDDLVEVPAAQAYHQEVDDNTDMLDWNTAIDTDSAAANAVAIATFALRKKEYEKLKAQGYASQADDIRFAVDEAAEQRRLRNFERSQMVLEDPPRQTNHLPLGYVEEESLFIPETPALPEPRLRKRAAPKPRNGLTKKEQQEALSIGINAGFGEARKPKRKQATSQDRQPRKRRESKNGVKKPAQKRGRKSTRPNLSNVNSLGRTNIVQAAQANASRPDMPTFTSRHKTKALSELIASIPSAERGAHTSDRAAILEATKKFRGHAAVKSDGHGGWKLKGMESSLYHHQLLGAAFLRDRENGTSKPRGGMVCDEMGFGKTIQMIANILDGKVESGSPLKTTLIVAPPALLNQWMTEMDKHVKEKEIGRILRYHSGYRLHSNNIRSDLMAYDVILTTYGEVQKSYPLAEPPKHLSSEEKKNEWWRKFYQENVGPLHQCKFHRIVLDEAHHIKNHTSKTSIAACALTGTFRWCITGTPILNYIEELFPYFSFLKVPHTGSFETFCHNYCNNRTNKEPVNMSRIHNILRAIMLRRTHVDSLFNAPIVKLPGITHTTIMVEFNSIERAIYNMVKTRYISQINKYSRSGALTANYRNILGMLNRLRMLCSHLLLCQDTLKQMFVASDVENLWRLSAKEVEAPDGGSQKNMIAALRNILQNKKNTIKTCQTKELDPSPNATPEVETEESLATGSAFGLYFKFRKFLRALSESNTWTELHLRSTCAKCHLPPDEPVCTSCFHVYCKECICAMEVERRQRGEEKITCRECGALFEETSPCSGLEELGFNSPAVAKKVEKRKNPKPRRSTSAQQNSQRQTSVDEEGEEAEKDPDWIEIGGALLPSPKLVASKAAILNWRQKSPGHKILVYTQFLGLCRIFSKVCSVEGWGHVMFHGKMSVEARERAIEKFRDDPEICIMICSLKAGGVGLNLNMASKVIILDLWFNTAVEAQAYCRAFRIGQERKVEVLRFVVRDSIDEDLIKMQDRKDVEVSGAIGPESHSKRASIAQLLELFGEVREEGENEFILVEDEGDDEDDSDVDMAARLPPRPF